MPENTEASDAIHVALFALRAGLPASARQGVKRYGLKSSTQSMTRVEAARRLGAVTAPIWCFASVRDRVIVVDWEPANLLVELPPWLTNLTREWGELDPSVKLVAEDDELVVSLKAVEGWVRNFRCAAGFGLERPDSDSPANPPCAVLTFHRREGMHLKGAFILDKGVYRFQADK